MSNFYSPLRTLIKVRYVVYLLVGLVGSTGLQFASAQTSKISGSVQDSENASIPGAKISLTRKESGEHREAVSGPEGFYSFPLLLSGHYELKVENDGFETELKSGIQVLTGEATAVDFSLKPGSLQQVVSVSTDAPLLQSGSSAISTVVENQTITNLPLLDRRTSQLQRLSGFVIANGSGSNSTFAIAGGRGNNGNFTIDGGTVTNLLQGVSTLTFDPPVDSVQEFNLALSNYSAELGRSGGGVIQMTTKSGTNEFHGSAYEYYRDASLQAKPYFANSNPPLKYNLFGGSIGGPIIKDRTQFFFSWEARLNTSTVTQTLNVPTPAEVKGDFSAFSAVVINPNTGKQAVGDDGTLNKLPSKELDPIGVKLASYYPAPNIPGAQANTNNFSANDTTKTVLNAYVARIDHKISDKDRIYGRFLGQPDHGLTASIFPVPGTDNYGNLSHNYYYNGSATWDHIFSSSVINEFLAAYTRRQGLNISAGSENPALATQTGLQGTNPDYFPGVTLSGLEAIGRSSQQVRLQTPIIANQYLDNLSILHGVHQFKIGVELRTSDNTDRYYPSAGGLFSFNNIGISSNTAIGSLASLLLGRVSTASRQETKVIESKALSIGAYAQDDWHLSPKLTLNIGIRYDVDSPRYVDNNYQNSFNPAASNPISNTPGIITFSGLNGVSKYAHNWDLHNFGPRLGFAYSLFTQTVIRGGGAILVPGEYDQATPITAYTGFSNAISLSSPNPGKGTPAFLLKNNGTDGTGKAAFPVPSQLTSSFGAVPVGSAPVVAPQYYEPHRLTGYLYQANLDIQQALTSNLLLDVGYLGTFGHHLASPDAESINQVAPANVALLPTAVSPQALRPFPQFGNVSILAADIGESNYNGLNVGLNKKYNGGLQYQLNYTWSKFIDNQDSRNELAGYPGTDSFTDYYHPNNRRGLSGNDVRNRLIGNALYALPVGHGKLLNINSHLLNQIVGGWTVAGIAEIHSGTALSVVNSTNNTGTFSDGVRPNLVGNPNRLSSSRPRAQKIAEWFDTSAFAQNPAYTFGNAPRTFGRGPGLFTADASLMKDISFGEARTLQFRAEALNVLNHANLGNPNGLFGSSKFGTISSLQTGTQSRILQLGVHLSF
jgi:hypothetical protein